jgi:hypothetical protein
MNIIETAMRQRSCNLQEAMDYAGDLVVSRMLLFKKTQKNLPSWGERVDKDLAKYLGGRLFD